MAKMQDPYGWNENQRLLHMCKCTFDAHIHDIFTSLMIGSIVVILGKNFTYDIQQIIRTINVYKVSVAGFVPSLARPLFSACEKDDLISITKIVFAVESLNVSHIRSVIRVNENIKIYNMIGLV
jgi:non-ribosomal peptide synthetase component F